MDEDASMEASREAREELLATWIDTWKIKAKTHANKAMRCRMAHTLLTLPTVIIPLGVSAIPNPEEETMPDWRKYLLLVSAACGGAQSYLKLEHTAEKYALASRNYWELIRDAQEALLLGARTIHELNKRADVLLRDSPLI